MRWPENGLCLPAVAIEDDVRGMLRTKTPPLRNGEWVACCERSKDGRKRRFPSAVLSVDEREASKREVCTVADRVEQPDVPN